MSIALRRQCVMPLAVLLLLAACDQGSAPKDAPTSTAPDAKPGLALTGGHLVLPTVAGNPGAAYFTLANGGTATATLAAVDVDGADKAEMHQTSGGAMAPLAPLDVAAGKSVAFAPGGKHVMVFGLDPKLAPGASVTMTLTFADGDKLSAPLKVAKAGGMDHGDMP